MKQKTLRIGVTGHRILPHLQATTDTVQQVLQLVQKIAIEQTGHKKITVVSPLAEGADRLVVREALKLVGTTLETPLPLEAEDYLTDFDSPESKEEFKKLLKQSQDILILPPKSRRNLAYQAVGRYVVDHCDIVITIWNGRNARGPGGTAEIVEYARKKKKPLIWIHSEQPKNYVEERLHTLNNTSMEDELNVYLNNEEIDPEEFATRINRTREEYLQALPDADHPFGKRLNIILDHFLEEYVRADLLAGKYQRYYKSASKAIYVLAAFAVIILSLQYIFHLNHWIGAGEIVAIFLILLILRIGNKTGWHRRWVNYRFLAEQVRCGIFMALLSGQGQQSAGPPRPYQWVHDSWSLNRYRKLWRSKPDLPPLAHDDMQIAKGFIDQAWFDDQKEYHLGKTTIQLTNHYRISFVAEMLFWLTLGAALLHVMPNLFHLAHISTGYLDNDLSISVLTFLAIALPTGASASTGLRAHFDMKKIGKQSELMERRFVLLQKKLYQAKTIDELQETAREAEAIMLQESADWYQTIGFHELEAA